MGAEARPPARRGRRQAHARRRAARPQRAARARLRRRGGLVRRGRQARARQPRVPLRARRAARRDRGAALRRCPAPARLPVRQRASDARCAPGCAPRWMRTSASARRSPGCARSSRSRTAASASWSSTAAWAASERTGRLPRRVRRTAIRCSRRSWNGSPTPTRRPATQSRGSRPSAPVRDLLTVVGPAPRRPGRRKPAPDRAVEQPSQVRQAVPGGLLHHGAAGHDSGHPPLPRFRADQGDRTDDGRADGGALRHRGLGDHRRAARAG